MNISHIRYAVEVAKTRSITKAAENLYMGQPNLSRAIKELEESIGITIFSRTSKGVIPTELGAKFLGYARNILSQIEEIEALYNPNETNKLFLNLSVPRALYIAHALSEFVSKLDKSKGLEINFKEADNLSTINNVLQNNFSLGIIRYDASEHIYYKKMLKDKDLDFRLLSEFKYHILISEKSSLARDDAISIKQLDQLIEVSCFDSADSDFLTEKGDNEEKAIFSNGKRIKLHDMNNLLNLLSRVECTYAWSPPVHKDILSRYLLVQKECKECKKTYQNVLIYRSCYKFNEAENALIKELEDSNIAMF